MIKFIIAAVTSLFLISHANAQSFPGYGPAGGLYVGQGNAGAPIWLLLNGDCVSSSSAAIVCTMTNGVPFYTGLPAPVNPADATTKAYVDASATGLTVHTMAVLATTAALPANTYSNGSSGVGATLTSTCVSSCPAPTIDGTAVTVNQRILVKNEAAPANNGIYTVTTVGTGSTPYVLTRATDANTPGTLNPNQIGAGTYIHVTGGTANASTSWTVNSAVTTIGTSAINWAQFSASAGVGSVNGLAGALTLNDNGGATVTSSGTTITVGTPGGYLNKFRNATFDVWQRGISALPASTSGAYTADGWRATQTGAAFNCSRQAGNGGTLFSLRCVGGTSNTDTTYSQRIESYIAAPLAGNTVTVQFWYQQNTGGAITPRLSTCFASAQDNFATCTGDLTAVSLSSCASATWCLESYTFPASASAGNGYSVNLDCNTALTSAQFCQITAADG